jgi:hypothetical protein
MKINIRRVVMDALKTLVFALALLYLADYFGWSLFSEAGGNTAGSDPGISLDV